MMLVRNYSRKLLERAKGNVNRMQTHAFREGERGPEQFKPIFLPLAPTCAYLQLKSYYRTTSIAHIMMGACAAAAAAQTTRIIGR
jgi:hypothetical protein